eukprot:scaffold143840_cov65-Attheya_sp.AAC.1
MCLSDPDEYKKFCRFVLNDNKNLEKIAVLYGYVPADDYIGISSHNAADVGETVQNGVRDGEHAAQLVLEAIRSVSSAGGELDDSKNKDLHLDQQPLSNRSYGCTTKGGVIAQDADTGAVMEVLATR